MRVARVRLIQSAVAVAACLALVSAAAVPASADPPNVPDPDDIVGVGGDSTAALIDELAWVHNQEDPVHRVASFDAIGWPTIVVRPGIAISRPDDSGSGIWAVSTRADLDFARSSRGPISGDPWNVGFIRFAVGNLRWMASDDLARMPSLTHAQLVSIYHCSTTNWAQLGGPFLQIQPLIPYQGSGIRQAWVERMGLNNNSLPSCVRDIVGGTPVRSNDPTQVAEMPGAIAPVSEGRYRSFSPAPVGAYMGAVAPPDSARYQQELFNVVKLVDGLVPPQVADVFGDGFGTNASGESLPWICRPAPGSEFPEWEGPAEQIIEDQGFTQLPVGVCGTFG